MSKHNHTPTTLKPQNGANTAYNKGKFSCYQNGNDGIEINLSDDVINHNQNDDSCNWCKVDPSCHHHPNNDNSNEQNININLGLNLDTWLMLIVLVLLVYGCSPAHANVMSNGQSNASNGTSNRNNDFSYALHCKGWISNLTLCNSAFQMRNFENKRVSQFDLPLQGYPQSDTTFDFCRDGENLHSFLAPEDVSSEFLHTLKNGTFSVPQNKDRVSSEMRPFSNSTFQTPNSEQYGDKTEQGNFVNSKNNKDKLELQVFGFLSKIEQNYHAKKETVGKKETNTAGNRKQKKPSNSSDNKEEQGVEVFPFLGNSEQKETLFISNSPLYAYCSQNPLRVCVLLRKVDFNPLTNGNKQGYDGVSLATTSKNRGEMDFFQSIKEKNISQSLPTSPHKNLSNFHKNNLFIKNPLTDNKSQGYDKALSNKLIAVEPNRNTLAFFVSKTCLDPQSSKELSANPLTHLQGKTIISKMSKSSTTYDGATLQNTIAFGRICRAVAISTESEPHHPIFNNSVVSTQKLIGGLSNA